MSLSKCELKAIEYRTRAANAHAAALAEVPERARELLELSAAKWTQLAEAEEVRALHNRVRLA